MPEGYVDPILERLHRELPGVVPKYGIRGEQYLLSWQPVADDETGALRKRLRALRKELCETSTRSAFGRAIHGSGSTITTSSIITGTSRAGFPNC